MLQLSLLFSKISNPLEKSLSTIHLLLQASMAASSEKPSATEQMAQSSILHLQANQNMILNLYPTKYDGFLQLIVECLRYSLLVIALTKSKIVSMVNLSKAYSTASYTKGDEFIIFEIFNQKTQITNSRFCNLLGLPQGSEMIGPENVSNSAILEMFYQMGYKETLTTVSKFKKPNFPSMWNNLFTLQKLLRESHRLKLCEQNFHDANVQKLLMHQPGLRFSFLFPVGQKHPLYHTTQ